MINKIQNLPADKAKEVLANKEVNTFVEDGSIALSNMMNEAYSIGGVAEGFTPLMMAGAYSAFASGGYYTEPYSVTKIEFRETGEVVEYKHSKTRVMKDSTAYIMNNILESAVNYAFNGGAKVPGSHVAAKTGTSNYPDSVLQQHGLPAWAVNDLWTVAYTSQYSVAVWYGYDNVDSNHYNTEGRWKDNLVAAVMTHIPKDTRGWVMPSSVVASNVEKDTYPAKLPSENTPKDMITTEYFVRGTQPTEVSERYQKLDNVSNVKVNVEGNTAKLSWEYETPTVLTDEYLDRYFSQSVFVKSKDKLVEERKNYNNNVLGKIIFGIYVENEDKTLTLVTHTEDMNYVYKGKDNESVKLVIKAEHANYGDNASTGTALDVKLSAEKVENLKVKLNGDSSIETEVGKYVEKGIKSIMYGETDITTSSSVKIPSSISLSI